MSPLRVPAGGQELGYAEVLNYSTVATSTTPGDAAGLAVTVTTGTRPIFVEAFMPSTAVNAAGRSRMSILEGATVLQLGDSCSVASGLVTGCLCISVRLTPTAGSHTYKIQMATVIAASGSYTSGATFPAYIRVVEQ